MLTFDDILNGYKGHPDITPDIVSAINNRLLPAVWVLEKLARDDGIEFPINPATGTSISGSGNGGFRPRLSKVGAPNSNHKRGLAVDCYDPKGEIDAWCMANLGKLETAGIWLEAPEATPGWSHWQCVAPRSGNRVFKP